MGKYVYVIKEIFYDDIYHYEGEEYEDVVGIFSDLTVAKMVFRKLIKRYRNDVRKCTYNAIISESMAIGRHNDVITNYYMHHMEYCNNVKYTIQILEMRLY